MGVAKSIVLVVVDTWEGLYIDGELKRQGHNIDKVDFLECLGIAFDYKWCNNKWLEELGELPKNLKDVVWE